MQKPYKFNRIITLRLAESVNSGRKQQGKINQHNSLSYLVNIKLKLSD